MTLCSPLGQVLSFLQHRLVALLIIIQTQCVFLWSVSGLFFVLLVSSQLTLHAVHTILPQLDTCIPVCVCVFFVCVGVWWQALVLHVLVCLPLQADVLVGQNWRALLPCVSITRWPPFPGTACQIHPWKMNFQKHRDDLQAWLSNVQESMRVFIRPGKAAGQCLIEVQLFPQTSLTPVKWWKKTLLNNLLCIGGGWGATWGGRLWMLLWLGGLALPSPCHASHCRNYNGNFFH